MCNYKNHSEGFILLPMLFMLLTAAIILMSLTHHFYAHVLFNKEVRYYFAAEAHLTDHLTEIEHDLSYLNEGTPDTQNQEVLFAQLDDWPKLDAQLSYYSQLIHKNEDALIYSTLLVSHDNLAATRLKYELISSCTLADHACHPLQLTSM